MCVISSLHLTCTCSVILSWILTIAPFYPFSPFFPFFPFFHHYWSSHNSLAYTRPTIHPFTMRIAWLSKYFMFALYLLSSFFLYVFLVTAALCSVHFVPNIIRIYSYQVIYIYLSMYYKNSWLSFNMRQMWLNCWSNLSCEYLRFISLLSHSRLIWPFFSLNCAIRVDMVLVFVVSM